MRSTSHGPRLAAAAALAAILAVSGCHSLSPEPAPAASTMTGQWQMDPAGSDDFEQKMVAVLRQARRHDAPRPPVQDQGAPGPQRQRAEVDPLIMPAEDPDKMRTRIGDDLQPASALRIKLIGEGVEITRDSEPTRLFKPAQSISRIDSSGAARLECGWDQGAFVIRAKYTNHGTRSWRLEHDAAADTLRVTFVASNPEFGHLELHTLYRRAPGTAP